MLAGQRADGLPLLVADAVHDELGEAAVVVGDAEGGVLRVEQFAGGGDDRLQDVAHLQVPAHRQQRGADRVDAASGAGWACPHGTGGADRRMGRGGPCGTWVPDLGRSARGGCGGRPRRAGRGPFLRCGRGGRGGRSGAGSPAGRRRSRRGGGIMPVAIITGASKGLGRALAAALAARGWDLVLDGRDAEALRRRRGPERRGGPPRGTAAAGAGGAGDVTDPAHRAELVAAARELGGVDLLVNNASALGAEPLVPLEELPVDGLRRALEINVVAPLALVQEALPLLRAARRARC